MPPAPPAPSKRRSGPWLIVSRACDNCRSFPGRCERAENDRVCVVCKRQKQRCTWSGLSSRGELLRTKPKAVCARFNGVGFSFIHRPDVDWLVVFDAVQAATTCLITHGFTVLQPAALIAATHDCDQPGSHPTIWLADAEKALTAARSTAFLALPSTVVLTYQSEPPSPPHATTVDSESAMDAAGSSSRSAPDVLVRKRAASPARVPPRSRSSQQPSAGPSRLPPGSVIEEPPQASSSSSSRSPPASESPAPSVAVASPPLSAPIPQDEDELEQAWLNCQRALLLDEKVQLEADIEIMLLVRAYLARDLEALAAGV